MQAYLFIGLLAFAYAEEARPHRDRIILDATKLKERAEENLAVDPEKIVKPKMKKVSVPRSFRQAKVSRSEFLGKTYQKSKEEAKASMETVFSMMDSTRRIGVARLGKRDAAALVEMAKTQTENAVEKTVRQRNEAIDMFKTTNAADLSRTYAKLRAEAEKRGKNAANQALFQKVKQETMDEQMLREVRAKKQGKKGPGNAFDNALIQECMADKNGCGRILMRPTVSGVDDLHGNGHRPMKKLKMILPSEHVKEVINRK